MDSRESRLPVTLDTTEILEEDEVHYVGEENTLFYVDCDIDVSMATSTEVFIRRPDGSTIEKVAIITKYNSSSNFLLFRINAGDFNQPGRYRGQVKIKIGSVGWGDAFYIKVVDPISSSSCSSSGGA